MSGENLQASVSYKIDSERGVCFRENISFLAVFCYLNKEFFYTSFSKKRPVSGKEIDNSDSDGKGNLYFFRFTLGCFMLGVVLLGCGIPFLCLDILFKLAVAMTVIGAICSVIYLSIAIVMACCLRSQVHSVLQIGALQSKIVQSEYVLKGYQLGDSIIPVKPEEEKKNEDEIKK